MKVTNNSRAITYDFVKAGGKAKDGVPETVSIAPGETATLDVAESDLVRLHGAIAFGELTASAKDTERAAAALASEPEGSSSRRPKPPQVI
jgi:hypothetical protein